MRRVRGTDEEGEGMPPRAEKHADLPGSVEQPSPVRTVAGMREIVAGAVQLDLVEHMLSVGAR